MNPKLIYYNQIIQDLYQLKDLLEAKGVLKISLENNYWEYSFISQDKSNLNFHISLSIDKDFPNMSFIISDNTHRLILIDYLTKNDVIENISLYILNLLSNRIIKKEVLLKDTVIKVSYIYFDLDRFTEHTSFEKFQILFPWQKKHITKKEFHFEPWITNKYTKN